MQNPTVSRPSVGAALACAAALLAVAAPPARSASAVGHVSVTILPTAAGVGGSAMSFGTVGVASAPGRVVLSPAGRASGPAGYSFGGSPAPASVTLTGTPGTALTVSLSGGDVARGPGAPMPFRVVAATAGAISALDRAGMLRLSFGATLSVGRSQAPGAYHGTYTVTVDY
jgi:spore coat protein U-like protein